MSIERIHLADAARYVGFNVLLRNRAGTDDLLPIAAVAPLGSQMLLAIGSTVVALPATQLVKVFNPRQKQEHLANAGRAFNTRELGRPVHASCLSPLVGHYIDVETGGSRAPHLILAVRSAGDRVELTVSHNELIASFDYVVRVCPAHQSPA